VSLAPTAIAEDSRAGMWVVVDDDGESEQVLLIPCSFAHRRVVTRGELATMTLHKRSDAGTTS
jgi:hypothetical protein